MFKTIFTALLVGLTASAQVQPPYFTPYASTFNSTINNSTQARAYFGLPSGGVTNYYFDANQFTVTAATNVSISSGAILTNPVVKNIGTSTTVQHGNASGTVTYSQVSLTADVTGVLPVPNGGATNHAFGAQFTVSGGTNVSLANGLVTTNEYLVTPNTVQMYIAQSATVPGYSVTNLTTYGIGFDPAGALYAMFNGVSYWKLSAANAFRVFNSSALPTFNGGASDTGVSFLRRVNTTTSGTVTLSATVQGGASVPACILNNSGASGTVTYNLPTAAIGAYYTFTVMAAQSIIIQVDTGSTIQQVGSVTTSSGTLTSIGTLGNTVTIVCVAANKWVVIAINGLWTAA